MISLLATRATAWQRGSVHRQVFSAAMIVAIFTFAAKLAGAAKEVVVAQRFGTSADVDAFLLALVIPSFAISVVASSLRTALVPTYVDVREQEGPAAAQRLLSTAMVLALGLMTGTTALLAWAMPTTIALFARGFPPDALRLTTLLSYWMLPGVGVAGATTIWTAVLHAHQRFTVASAAPLAIPLFAIAGLATFGRTWGIQALAAGTLVGFVVEAAVVGAAVRHEGLSVLPSWRGVTPAVRRVAGQYWPMVAGTLVMGSNPVVDSIMAAALGSGSVAALGYGGKVNSLILSVGASSVAAAVLPHFSLLAARRDWSGLRRTTRTYAAVLIGLSVPVAIALVALSEPLARVIFQRGAFTAADTALVARIQAYYFVSMPIGVAGVLFVRLIIATKATKFLMWLSVMNAVVNVTANYAFSRVLGVAGIALSTSLVSVLSPLVAFAYASRRLRLLAAAESSKP
jgi:putative peptidoglycan lipid II flippase